MAFFHSKKKEKETVLSACACNCECPVGEANEVAHDCCSELEKGICCIKVLGSGCKSCHEQYENAKEAVKSMGLAVEAEYITDMQEVMKYGVMRLPALVVKETVVSMGRVLKASEVERLLHEMGF